MSILSRVISKITGNLVPEIDVASFPLMEYVVNGEINRLLTKLSDKDINKLIGVLLSESRRRKQGN